jgi:hypothetical protein
MTYGRTRHRLHCAHCREPFWTTDPKQGCCSAACAARRRCHVQVPADTAPVGYRESYAHVDHLYAQARAARLAEERRTGQRRHTIETGWQQRDGVHTAATRLAIWRLSE